MIKKIKIEVVEEKKKRTYKNSIEVKLGSMAQEKMKELAADIYEVLDRHGLIEQNGEEEE